MHTLKISYKSVRKKQVKLWPAILAVLCACWFIWGCPAKSGPPAEGFAAEVKDGDTIVLTDGRKVRYLGMDTPELSSTDPRELELARRAKQVNSRTGPGGQTAPGIRCGTV